jgi:peptidoglycan hydrolase-like protein with peptidoglycan-binding domain
MQVVAHAEQSDAAVEFLKKKKKKPGSASNATTGNASTGDDSLSPFRPNNDRASSGHAPVSNTKATTETEIVVDRGISPMLSEQSGAALQAAESRYAAIVANGGWPKVPKGTFKKGASNKAVAVLNRRLYVEGYLRVEGTQGDVAGVYTSATEAAVSAFQRNMGLVVSGKVDGPTLDALNVSANARLATIRANIPRLSTYGANLGDRYVVVNVPAQQIETVSGGRVYSRHNAIVGRPERPTPVVMTALSDVNFNPYWNAPVSIVEKDIIPKLAAGGSDYVKEYNIKIFKGYGGPEVDPDTVDWGSAIADDYYFRQEPGEKNAMATAKVNFTSPFGIYMHDTPDRHLFGTGSRFYSSGCVRVDKMPVFLNWVLNNQDGYNSSKIASLAETLERVDVKLVAPPQLRVTYLTAWPAANGTVAFRRDVYELDGTGFVVGQPMPVGETAPDGQRFVLKPLPRLVASVADDEPAGFGLFGFKRSSKVKTSTASAIKEDGKKITSTSKMSSTKKEASSGKSKTKPKGLFDWGNSKKAASTDKSKSKKTVKKTTETASATKTKKKVVKKDEKEVASKDAAKTTKKKVISADTTKVAAKTPETDPKKKAVKKDETAKAAETAKKKATTTAKKATDCKPGKDGKLPKGCEAPAQKAVPVPKPNNTASATN